MFSGNPCIFDALLSTVWGFKCSGHWFCNVRSTSMIQLSKTTREHWQGWDRTSGHWMLCPAGSGTSSLGDLLPVSWPLWVSSLNERADLEALKIWDSNLQFYSDTLSIRLTFLPNSPFLREYIITLHLSDQHWKWCQALWIVPRISKEDSVFTL